VQVSNGRTGFGLTETVLVENAALDARPQLATGPNGQMALVWNGVSKRGAADAVSLRLFDGATWGTPIPVSRPERPSFTPVAAFAANGNLLIAWAEAQTDPDSAGLTVAFARSLDIAWAEVLPTTGQIARRGFVTSDDVMDFAPRLRAAGDGSLWLVWQRSPAANIAGTTAAPNQWNAAAWTGSAWTAPETAGQNGVGTLFWDVAAVDAHHLWLVSDIDTDGNFATSSDREIYLYKRTAAGWAAPIRLTNNAVIDSGPLLSLTTAGQPVVAWRQGDSILGLVGDPANTQPQIWFDASVGVGPLLGAGRLLVGADGARAMLWAEGTAQGQDIWLARFNPATQVWSQPLPLFERAEQRRALSASILPGGDIVLGLAAVTLTKETVTFDGGGSAEIPTIGDSARLLVARIPSGHLPTPAGEPLFLPLITR
jgi:hypothetical protein